MSIFLGFILHNSRKVLWFSGEFTDDPAGKNMAVVERRRRRRRYGGSQYSGKVSGGQYIDSPGKAWG